VTDDDLVNALRALPRQSLPPAELEGQVVSRLREEGLLVTRPVRWTYLAAAVLAMALFLGGYAIGRTRDLEPTHVLLVHRLASTPEQSRERTREYGAWARNLAGGAKLAQAGWVLDASRAASSPTNEVSGYFLIRASGDAEALAIAKSCPHIRHGGSVELRRIER